MDQTVTGREHDLEDFIFKFSGGFRASIRQLSSDSRCRVFALPYILYPTPDEYIRQIPAPVKGVPESEKVQHE